MNALDVELGMKIVLLGALIVVDPLSAALVASTLLILVTI